jgi:hypothetical protein
MISSVTLVLANSFAGRLLRRVTEGEEPSAWPGEEEHEHEPRSVAEERERVLGSEEEVRGDERTPEEVRGDERTPEDVRGDERTPEDVRGRLAWLETRTDGLPVKAWTLIGALITVVTIGFGAWWTYG